MEYVSGICKIGIPTALQGMAYCVISMVLARMVSVFGAEAVAVQRVGGQIESLSWNTADGFAAALNAFVGQNYGANKMDRVKKGYRASLWTVGTWGLIITAIFVFVPKPIARIFFHEATAIEIAVDYLIIVGLSEAFMCVELMTVGALSGLGKTHLLNAIGNYVKTKFPGKRILYTNAEAFVNDYVEAIGNNTIASFNRRYRSVDILLIDDIQFIANKEGSMEMFFNIFNTLQHSGKQIVITSDKPPVELKGMENRLVSRFRQGLTVTIDNPEFETAKAILKKKIESRMIDYPIDEEVLDFIASHFNKDVRDLEGAVTTLLFYKVVCGQNLDHISLDFALEAFDNPDNTTTITKKEATPDTIKETVASYYNLSVTQLTSKSRTNNIITARHIAMYLVRELVPDISYIQIGQEFGGRDHSTIMKACSKVKKKMKQDPNYKTAINDLMERLS